MNRHRDDNIPVGGSIQFILFFSSQNVAFIKSISDPIIGEANESNKQKVKQRE